MQTEIGFPAPGGVALPGEGYVVLIPDLFARGRVKPLCVARAIRTTLRGDGPEMADLDAAEAWPAHRPEVDPDRIGAIGFCLGGSFALLLGRTGRYKVSAPSYSGRITTRTAASSPFLPAAPGLRRG